MWCPRCGSSQRDWWHTRDVLEELKLCKECGANLYAVRQVVLTNEKSTKSLTGTILGWLRWLQSSEEAVRRQQALEIARGLTPEVKRYNEIKGGIITGSVGVALMIFLYVFMQGIIISGKVPNDTAEILSRIWVAGVIPVFVGLALTFNGVFISKKALASSKRAPNSTSELTSEETPALRSANTAEFLPLNFSVTENTTRHLNQKEESR
jgi:hypothetical protein